MSELPNHHVEGGAPPDPDMPDYVRAVYTSVKNTWQDAENLDDIHGYTSYIWIPEETFKVDVMKLHVWAEKFRAHSKSALAGGAKVVSSETAIGSHTHAVVVGTKTSVGGGAHDHGVTGATSSATTPNHTHDVAIGGTTSTESAVNYPVVASLNYGSECGAGKCVVGVNTALVPLASHTHDVNYGTKTSEAGGASHTHTVSGQTTNVEADHVHNVNIGTVTSASGGGSHSHNVELPDHTHPIDFGIYEEDITGRTLSAILYDPDGNLVKDFGVVCTGEDSVILDLSEYFETLKYGTWRLELTASGRIRARLLYYELCKMYAQF